MKEKEFDALVKAVEKKLFKEEYSSIHYSLAISGYNNKDIEFIVGKAFQNLTGCGPGINGLACMLATSLLEIKQCMGKDFSNPGIDLAWEAAKLLFYEKAKTSTEAIILSKK